MLARRILLVALVLAAASCGVTQWQKEQDERSATYGSGIRGLNYEVERACDIEPKCQR